MSIGRTKVREPDPSEIYLEQMKSLPLRSMHEIREDLYPDGEPPPAVMVTRLERKMPGRHRYKYQGPPLWQLRNWFLWNFGDLWSGLYEQDGYRPHRTV